MMEYDGMCCTRQIDGGTGWSCQGYEERLRNAPGLAEVLVILKEASATKSQGSQGPTKSCPKPVCPVWLLWLLWFRYAEFLRSYIRSHLKSTVVASFMFGDFAADAGKLPVQWGERSRSFFFQALSVLAQKAWFAIARCATVFVVHQNCCSGTLPTWTANFDACLSSFKF